MLAAGGGEVAELGCLPGPEAAQLAHPPGRKQKPSGQSYCVDPRVGRHGHVARQSADVCLSLSLFLAHTTKYCKRIQHIEKNTAVV